MAGHSLSNCSIWLWMDTRITRNAEQRITIFEQWCWKKLLRITWTARTNNSVLNEVALFMESSKKKIMLKYFGHTILFKYKLLEQTLVMLENIKGNWKRGGRKQDGYLVLQYW